MNAKLLSLLFVLFLGIGFSSCSKDSDPSSYDSGKSQGEKFRTAVSSISGGNLLSVVEICYKYKQNSSDADWKKGFLGGATNFDESKYSGLESLLNQDIDMSNISDITTTLRNLLNLNA